MTNQARPRTQELRRVQQEAALKRAKQRRILMSVGAVVIVGLLAAIAVTLVQAADQDDPPAAVAGTGLVPQHLSAAGAIPVGAADAPVAVEIYFDYMCPACGAFEAANSAELDRLITSGVARVELRPISFLDEQSDGTRYSTRSANAVAVIADSAPDLAWDFHDSMYAHQPPEGGKGLSDEQIAALATDVGVPADVVDRFTDDTFEAWVASVTQDAFDGGLTGTPTVKINGVVFAGDLFEVGPLTEAIESAAGQ
jgi:protein-disulfide isomerase